MVVHLFSNMYHCPDCNCSWEEGADFRDSQSLCDKCWEICKPTASVKILFTAKEVKSMCYKVADLVQDPEREISTKDFIAKELKRL